MLLNSYRAQERPTTKTHLSHIVSPTTVVQEINIHRKSAGVNLAVHISIFQILLEIMKKKQGKNKMTYKLYIFWVIIRQLSTDSKQIWRLLTATEIKRKTRRGKNFSESLVTIHIRKQNYKVKLYFLWGVVCYEIQRLYFVITTLLKELRDLN